MKTPFFVPSLKCFGPSFSSRLASVLIRPRRLVDIFCNVLFPLAVGVITYITSLENVLPGLVRNHLADGLWAYAFASYLLIIWDRKISPVWMLLMVASALGFEIMQSFNVIPGTGDGWDVLTYLLFFALCFLANPFFRNLYYKYKL